MAGSRQASAATSINVSVEMESRSGSGVPVWLTADQCAMTLLRDTLSKSPIATPAPMLPSIETKTMRST